MAPRSRPRRAATSQQSAVLTAIGLVDNKLDRVQSDVTRLQTEQSQQTTTLNGVDARVRQLEIEKINETRVQGIEGRLQTAEKKVNDLELANVTNLPKQEQLAKDIAELKADFKPVSQFVDRAKFMLPLITGVGGVAGAVLTALILKLLNIR